LCPLCSVSLRTSARRLSTSAAWLRFSIHFTKNLARRTPPRAPPSLFQMMTIYDVRTLATHFQQQALWGVRLVAEVIAAVGVVGLALSVLGLYAVIAYSVSQRTREIGIRMAVGASERRVLGMVLRQGLMLSAIGISAGLLLAFAVSTVIGDLLNGVNPRDPVVYIGGTALLLSVTLLATYLPARRASQVDPQAALRAD